jgi:cell division protein FtsL
MLLLAKAHAGHRRQAPALLALLALLLCLVAAAAGVVAMTHK